MASNETLPDEEMLEVFLDEAEEHLQKLNDSVLELEDNPDSEDAVDQIFRSSHTIKGDSATIGFDKVSEFSHLVEDVMSRVRDGDIDINEQIIELLFHSIDFLEAMIEQKAGEGEEEVDVEPLCDKLEKAKEVEDESELDFTFESEKGEETEEIEKVKVDKERLDKLMNLVGELLIKAKGREGGSGEEIKEITDEIRYEVMQARLTPANQIFTRYPRMVRDLAKSQEKKVDLEIKGGNIELDRAILEEISEPIVHLLRNAVDHGIEPPSERKDKGKSEKGEIRLEAKKEKEKAIVEVSDDGRGMDIETIKEVAKEKNLLTQEEIEEMSKQDILRVLCNPGFSTKKEVTEVSGRGVGLDVLRSKMREVNGEFEIQTEKDKGTTVRMLLPLHLAIVKSMTFRVGSETYAIPISKIASCTTIKRKNIKPIMDEKTFQHKGKDIPLVDLHDRFNIEGKDKSELNVIIISGTEEKIGLTADELGDVQEIIIKPFSGILEKNNRFSGATILPNGKPILVINVKSFTKLGYGKKAKT